MLIHPKYSFSSPLTCYLPTGSNLYTLRLSQVHINPPSTPSNTFKTVTFTLTHRKISDGLDANATMHIQTPSATHTTCRKKYPFKQLLVHIKSTMHFL